jgi:two-component sensor histidine kinase
MWVSKADQAIDYRVGVPNGMATGNLTVEELRGVAADVGKDIDELTVSDTNNELTIVQERRAVAKVDPIRRAHAIGSGQLRVQTAIAVERTTIFDQMAMLLPLLMWFIAAVLSWWLVKRLLILPLGRLKNAVTEYQPGDERLVLPDRLGPAAEIRELGQSFERAVERIEESERQMAEALEGQRRLVREVHHRVKNNLQVVASLLNIHGRSANTPDARSAYASISRRVGALSIVHRNHFADMEENRGIAMRPLITELAAELRAGAPEAARTLRVDLELDSVNTTQDVAVAVAFLVTEIVEFSMLHCPSDPIEISLRRTSELTAQLLLTSKVLVPDDDTSPGKVQFERIVGGLAKQLRSNLERKLGRYSVELPVFPPI